MIDKEDKMRMSVILGLFYCAYVTAAEVTFSYMWLVICMLAPWLITFGLMMILGLLLAFLGWIINVNLFEWLSNRVDLYDNLGIKSKEAYKLALKDLINEFDKLGDK